MQKILFICFLALGGLFQYWLWYGTGGYVANDKLEQELAAQTKTTNALQQRNHELITQINSIRGSSASLEAKSRYELNLIKPDEMLVKLPKSK